MADSSRADFAAIFTFGRPVPAPVRAADGSVVTVAPDSPRLGYDEGGLPDGLVVERGAFLGQGDRVRLRPGLIEELDEDGEPLPFTVLHELRMPAKNGEGGSIERRAWFTTSPRATVDACLSAEGTHRQIAVFPGYLPARPDAAGALTVRVRRQSWVTAQALAANNARAIADEDGRPLIGG